MIEITPRSRIAASVAVPGSKSITQRALVAAALADGVSKVKGLLVSEDTELLCAALTRFGVRIDREEECWTIHGNGGRIEAVREPIFLGNNGTATRFLASLASLGSGMVIIDGGERMRQRPIAPLLSALSGWGVDIVSTGGTGCPPLKINAALRDGIAGGTTVLPAGKSSQYLSSLLLVGPFTRQPATLQVEGEVLSRPYVAMTLAVMADFGIVVDCTEDYSWFQIPQGCYRAREYQVEGDASGASYFWAAAAVTAGRVEVRNVPIPSLQGDAMLLPLLARMGCSVDKTDRGVMLSGAERLDGITVDMGDMPDVVPTLAVVAAFAHGETRINNIGHLRIKECDRLSAVTSELRRLGVEVEEFDASMIIHGAGGNDDRMRRLHGAEIETYQDHRMAMSMAVAGLRIPGVKICGEECVAKSFPDFWERFTVL